ncbi:MAG: NADH-quinone oxidoreductase subunit NuoE [Bifidobacteriaceae bacterium]|jgi:NADH-quinone oxidoreductase subunit E|nr:NADH-quinone oxidoreductase subunit NuoE [Bifidobacteriaceae bacterium]
MSYDSTTLATLEAEFGELRARYPQPRSALLPMLHLVQSVDGYVSPDGIALCAASLGLSAAEVSAVATFYTQFRRTPGGTYSLGVCTTALCAIMGGDAIFERLSEYLGLANEGTTADGLFTLEKVECNAACDFAPVLMINWEFFDRQTPSSATAIVDALRAGEAVAPTRGPSQLRTFTQVARTLAGFPDGLADDGPSAGAPSLAGLELAREKGWTAPPAEAGQPGGLPENTRKPGQADRRGKQ